MLAASALGYAMYPDDPQKAYEEMLTAAFADMHRFFRIVFVGAFRDCGFAVDLDDGCEHVFSTVRLTFRRVSNIVQLERVVADQDADAPDASDGLSGSEAAGSLDQPRRRPGHRQRLRKKSFWKGAQASTPDTFD